MWPVLPAIVILIGALFTCANPLDGHEKLPVGAGGGGPGGTGSSVRGTNSRSIVGFRSCQLEYGLYPIASIALISVAFGYPYRPRLCDVIA